MTPDADHTPPVERIPDCGSESTAPSEPLSFYPTLQSDPDFYEPWLVEPWVEFLIARIANDAA